MSVKFVIALLQARLEGLNQANLALQQDLGLDEREQEAVKAKEKEKKEEDDDEQENEEENDEEEVNEEENEEENEAEDEAEDEGVKDEVQDVVKDEVKDENEVNHTEKTEEEKVVVAEVQCVDMMLQSICSKNRVQEESIEEQVHHLEQKHGACSFPVAQVLESIANMQQQKKHFDAAADYFSRSLKIYEQIGEGERIATVLRELGNLRKRQGNINGAVECYEHLMRIFELKGEGRHSDDAAAELASLYMKQGRTDACIKALAIYERKLFVLEQNFGLDTKHSESVLKAAAVASRKSEQSSNALEFYQRYLRVYISHHGDGDAMMDDENVANAYYNISWLCFEGYGNADDALKYMNRALECYSACQSTEHELNCESCIETFKRALS